MLKLRVKVSARIPRGARFMPLGSPLLRDRIRARLKERGEPHGEEHVAALAAKRRAKAFVTVSTVGADGSLTITGRDVMLSAGEEIHMHPSSRSMFADGFFLDHFEVLDAPMLVCDENPSIVSDEDPEDMVEVSEEDAKLMQIIAGITDPVDLTSMGRPHMRAVRDALGHSNVTLEDVERVKALMDELPEAEASSENPSIVSESEE